MHGELEQSLIPRTTCNILHGLFLVIAGWILFDGQGDLARRFVLFSFGLITFLRIHLTFFGLLKRRFDWSEFWGVTFALFVYQVGFAFLGADSLRSPGIVDVLAIFVFLFGGYLNTYSEYQRLRFKERPENRGRLYTEGLFKYARHINYFGDFLWVGAWAVVAANYWALLVPLILGLGFIFYFIPPLTKHLRTKYGDQYDAWSQRTKIFIPFIY